MGLYHSQPSAPGAPLRPDPLIERFVHTPGSATPFSNPPPARETGVPLKQFLSAVVLSSFATCTALHAQDAAPAPPARNLVAPAAGHILVPLSSISRPEVAGVRMHTHHLIHVPAGHTDARPGFTEAEFPPNAIQPVTGAVGETPASLACLYGQLKYTTGCNPTTLTTVATGGSKAVAIVDAYDYPPATADLTKFSKQFGLPAPITNSFSATFTVIFASGKNPGPDPLCADGNGTGCWGSESSLDIEMVHSMAPKAHIYLVEADSSSNADLYAAVAKAIALVKAAGGGEVSMSWGQPEYSTEKSDDDTFVGAGAVFFASTGDSPGTEYPSVSPNVIAVGGTTISRNPITWAFQKEITWDQDGSGFSSIEPRPSFQNGIESAVGEWRGVPDVAAAANPYTPVWIYDSYQTNGSPWIQIGGTSEAAPLWAGIVNASGHFEASSDAELTTIYNNAKTASDFRDIGDGACGLTYGYLAVAGWDPCTGIGAPYGKSNQ